MVAKAVGNQMYMQFKCKQGTYFGTIQEYGPYEKRITYFKENTLDMAMLKTSKQMTVGIS